MMRQDEKDREEWAALFGAAAGAAETPPDLGPRLLADYDAVMRARRAGPLAALGAVMVAVGGVLGAATAPAAGDDEAYVYLAAGLDPAGGFSAEVASWAEQ
jgi:hypothetical protein